MGGHDVRTWDVPRCRLGESPVWDHRSEQIVWVDIDGCAVHVLHPTTGKVVTAVTGQMVTAVQPEAAGWFLCTERGFQVRDQNWRVMSECEVIDPTDRVRMNDAAISSTGWVFGGTLSLEGAAGRCVLFRLGPDGRYEVLQQGVGLSNGIGWSPDGAVLYHVDSMSGELTRRRHDTDTSDVGEPDLVADLSAHGTPDGLSVDVAGRIWVAMWDGGCVLGVDPDGTIRERIVIPVARPSSTAFAGHDLRTLAVTSAQDADGAGGQLFTVPMAVPGVPVPVPELDPRRLERTAA